MIVRTTRLKVTIAWRWGRVRGNIRVSLVAQVVSSSSLNEYQPTLAVAPGVVNLSTVGCDSQFFSNPHQDDPKFVLAASVPAVAPVAVILGVLHDPSLARPE